MTRNGQRATITGKFGNDKLDLGTASIGSGGIAAFSDTLHIDKPRLWSPADPQLYEVSFTVRVDGKKVAGYSLHSGIRSIKVSGGRLSSTASSSTSAGSACTRIQDQGFAIDNARRDQLVAEAKALGATSCARTTRCTPTRMSWPTGSAC